MEFCQHHMSHKPPVVQASKQKSFALVETPPLRRGSSGGLVMWIHQVLKDGSFYKGAIDGNFGEQTEDAVKSLQKDRKLVVDGILGTQTWQAIAELARILTVG
jgi:peptidoglycan hydrolase-like protein with peptidoglycan-binding domain